MELEFEIQEEYPDHHYRTEIPNRLLDARLAPLKLYLVIMHFVEGKDISLSDWKYFDEKGLVETFSYYNDEILRILKSKNPQNCDSKKICEWCNGRSYVLQKHHFPIKRCDKGKETVNICPNCHYEFHYLSEVKYKFKNEFVVEVIT